MYTQSNSENLKKSNFTHMIEDATNYFRVEVY